MAQTYPTAQCTKENKAFRLVYTVQVDIEAPPEVIWQLLTNAEGFTDWNSTVTSLEGTIAEGERIKLKSTLDPKRTFKLKVKNVLPNSSMQWGSGAAPMFKGKRTYTLSNAGPGITRFTMSERFSGIMLPMIKGSLPDFRENFEQFANDIKTAAEAR